MPAAERCSAPSDALPRPRPAPQGLLKAGGLQAYKPQEVAALLWGFATLGHAPLRLLYTARPDWRWRRSKLKAAESGKQHGTLRDYQPGQLASVAWSLAAMRQVGGPAPAAAAPLGAWRGAQRGRAGLAPAACSLPAPSQPLAARLPAPTALLHCCRRGAPPLPQTKGPAFKAVWKEVCRRGPAMGKSPNVLVMLWQAAMAIRLEGGGDPLAGAQGEGAAQLLQVRSLGGGAAIGAAAAAWAELNN
jgi:hypothetical protein